eukprot:m.124838 g.124838  ORF g.124838 m.124838 type:complete len:296 (+) comp37857_c0_seq1:33-920(+)
MKTPALIAVFCCVFGVVYTQTFLPTSFTMVEIQKPADNERRVFNASLCHSTLDLHDGYAARVYFNLPYNPFWNSQLGIIHATVSNSSKFDVVLCKNLNASNLPNDVCSFTYEKEMGPNIYFEIVAGTGVFKSFTISVEFVKSKAELEFMDDLPQWMPTTVSPRHNTVDAEDDPMPQLVPAILSQTGAVGTTYINYFKFCLAQVTEQGTYDTIVTVTGTHPNSAFTMEVCSDIPCSIYDTPVNTLGSDNSFSAFNIVKVDTAGFKEAGVGYVAIVGSGGAALNEYTLNIRQVPANR